MMRIILALPSFTALLAGLILVFKGKEKHQNTLAVMMFTMSVALTALLTRAFEGKDIGIFLDLLSTTATLLAPSIFYGYVRRLTNEGRLRTTHILAAPAIIIFSLNVSLYYIMGWDRASEYFQMVMFGDGLGETPSKLYLLKRIVGSYVYRAVVICLVILVLVITSKHIKDFNKKLNDFYTDAHEKVIIPNRIINYGLVIILVGTLIILALPYRKSAERIPYAYPIGGILICISLVLITIYGYRSLYPNKMFRSLEEDERERRYQLASKPTEIIKAEEKRGISVLKERLENSVKNNFYLNPNVTLESLSTALSSNRSYVSSAIHEYYGCSFSDFVNSLRIEYATELLRENGGKLTMEDISARCGFNSLPSFYRSFSRYKHMTPTEWREQFLTS